MKSSRRSTLLIAGLVSAWTAVSLDAATPRIVVEAGQPGRAVPTTLHGIFFEDINYGADGGLYAELVQNRSFEHRRSLSNSSRTR
jgi:hypothetical protein